MGIKCPKCHFDNPDDTLYCGKCATPLPPSKEIPASETKTLKTPIIELARGSSFARRYEIIEELGKGGMGKVYRVFDKKIKEEVALKLIRPEIALDKNTIERFSNELKFARKLRHENVCQMFDLNEDEGTHYITMEYVPGEDLKSFIMRAGTLGAGKAVFIARQVCEGLVQAHKLGVVHRDLKPQNIMIDRDGNTRIMDFGIARSLEAKGLTESGVMIGTPQYMSPEQVEGIKADQRSDIYSLGIILYEMVTGKVPFEGSTPYSIAFKHKTESPPNPKEFNAQIPRDLSQVILKCLEKERKKRYQKAEELLTELSNIEKGIPTTDKVIPKRKTTLGIPRKRLKIIVVPAILILAAIVIVGGYFFYDRILQKGEKGEEQEMAMPAEPTIQKAEVAVPQFGNIEINSTPEGAVVYVNDKQEGMTPLKRELAPGTYRIKITMSPDYKEIPDDLEVRAGKTSSKNYTLTPVPKEPISKQPVPEAPVYTIRIDTIPEGADVRIDGDYKGKSPIKTDLQKSRCRLKIEKGEEWSTIDEELSLKTGLNSVHRTLKRIKYSLSIKTNPPEAQVSIGDEPLGITPVNKLVSVGEWDIKIEKEGYETIEGSINIDSDIDKKYDMLKLKPGIFRLKASPYAEILIDGKLIGEVPPTIIQEVEAGKHTIEFVATKINKKFTVEVEIKPGESKEVRMNMATGESKVVRISSRQ
jgi:serine/threonine-protein kinase